MVGEVNKNKLEQRLDKKFFTAALTSMSTVTAVENEEATGVGVEEDCL